MEVKKDCCRSSIYIGVGEKDNKKKLAMKQGLKHTDYREYRAIKERHPL